MNEPQIKSHFINRCCYTVFYLIDTLMFVFFRFFPKADWFDRDNGSDWADFQILQSILQSGTKGWRQRLHCELQPAFILLILHVIIIIIVNAQKGFWPFLREASRLNLSEIHLLFPLGWSHNHHVPCGTWRRVWGIFWTEQKKCRDHQLDSSTHEKVQEGEVSSSLFSSLFTDRLVVNLNHYCLYLFWLLSFPMLICLQ